MPLAAVSLVAYLSYLVSSQEAGKDGMRLVPWRLVQDTVPGSVQQVKEKRCPEGDI